MTEVHLNFLQHRRNYIELFVKLFNRTSEETRKLTHVNFLITEPVDFPSNTNFNYSVQSFGGHREINNYKNKMEWMVQQDCEYILKYDEDMFMGPHVIDYMVKNRNILDSSDILLLTPCVNIGVPTCDMFIEDFCTDNSKAEIEKTFLKQDLAKTAGERWDIDEFDILNNFTTKANEWFSNDYWDAVSALSTELKGIHPVRVSQDAQVKLCEEVIENIGQFMSKQEYSIVQKNYPYLCNDVSLMRTDVYRNIKFDPYDEININAYRKKNKLNFGYIRRGFAMHIIYAFVSHYIKEREKFESDIYNRLNQAITRYLHFDL